MATATYWADDVKAARDWYARLFGIDPYFQMPNKDDPAYVEFRIGDDADEFGIANRAYAPKTAQAGSGGVVLYWHVDKIEEAFQTLLDAGATEHEPITKRGDSGFVTASVRDPFGNILGIMHNPHFAGLHDAKPHK
jgi:predicted enzyme related to lactoylglutathione lyase